MRFVDTNILLYSISTALAETAKALIARELLRSHDLALSTQVLQEFYVQATRPSRAQRLQHDEAVALIATWQRYPVQDLTIGIVHRALEASARWQLSYWDAAIVEAARAVGCDTVLSEDLQHGQVFDGVRVLNPFRSDQQQ